MKNKVLQDQVKTEGFLYEVAFVRVILIVLLLLYHCFAIYTGKWPSLKTVWLAQDVWSYKWIGNFFYSFFLECFVFISGYVFEFQIRKKRLIFIGTLKKKASRILLPSIIFSVLYFVLFMKYDGIGSFIWQVINGCGHLWFLPMLFWCFVIGYFIRKIDNDELVVGLLVLLSIISYFHIPLRLGYTFYYLLFFILGGVFFKHRLLFKELLSRQNILILWSLFVVAFIFFYSVRFISTESMVAVNDWRRYFINCGNNMIKLICSLLGTLALYFTGLYVTSKQTMPRWCITVGDYCFGVYIIQQFVIRFLYYYSELPFYVNKYVLPWVTFAMVLPLCLIIAMILKKLPGVNKII